jgi:hypothetical protein
VPSASSSPRTARLEQQRRGLARDELEPGCARSSAAPPP